MPKIDLVQLEQQIATMSVRSNLYKTLKRSLKARSWWKNRPRGRIYRPPAKD